MKKGGNILKSYYNNEDDQRKIGWLDKILIIPVQKVLVAKYMVMVSEGNFYNALLFGKDIGIFQIKAKVARDVPVAHSQVRTFWQRCGVAMKSYDHIDKDLGKQGHRLVENPDQGFVRPASRELWKKRKDLGKVIE